MFLLLLLLLCDLAAATSATNDRRGNSNPGFLGTMWLYEHANFQGDYQRFAVQAADICYNLQGCFNNEVSSAQFSLPEDGNFFNNSAYLAFYTDENCNGTVNLYNLRRGSKLLDVSKGSKLDNKISAFMLMKTSMTPLSIGDGCASL